MRIVVLALIQQKTEWSVHNESRDSKRTGVTKEASKSEQNTIGRAATSFIPHGPRGSVALFTPRAGRRERSSGKVYLANEATNGWQLGDASVAICIGVEIDFNAQEERNRAYVVAVVSTIVQL